VGPIARIAVGEVGLLRGRVADDGLPDPPGTLKTAWSKVRGPGLATFDDRAGAAASVRFSLPGLYALRLTADDGDLSGIDDVLVEVIDSKQHRTRPDVRMASGWDDAEETPSGRIRLFKEDRELPDEGVSQAVALRFTGLAIPRNATILSASIQFGANDTITRARSLTIRGQAAGDAPAFPGALADPSRWRLTVAAVDWSLRAAVLSGASVSAQRTPDLTPVVQEIVCMPGWAPGNAIALVIAGTGERDDNSVESEPKEEPLLHIDYRRRPG
jgi:hypothetical protein